jgi:hypothetical protein
MQSLHDTRDAVYQAQLHTSMALEKAQSALLQTLEQASITPDGTAVFCQNTDHGVSGRIFARKEPSKWKPLPATST